MKATRPTEFDMELGKAICDRLGLPQNQTLQDYTTESAGQTVWLTMTVMQAISLEEYNELRAVAAMRAAA